MKTVYLSRAIKQRKVDLIGFFWEAYMYAEQTMPHLDDLIDEVENIGDDFQNIVVEDYVIDTLAGVVPCS